METVTQLLNGNATAREIRSEIAKSVKARVADGKKVPHLAAVLVGNDGGSEAYVSYKVKDCAEVGFKSSLIRRPVSVTQAEMMELVQELNNDPEIDGFIIQLPLPKHINDQEVLLAINPEKDVDGFHPSNVGKMALGIDGFLPATPSGILDLLDRNGISVSGKHCVVLGRSHIVGSPVSILLAQNTPKGNATVTLCHSRTQNLKEITKQADVLIAALGKPGFVTADMVKDGAVVIDVGTTRVQDSNKKSGFALKGDVDFENVSKISSAITPVPGGVGPMTRVALLMNTLKAVD